MENQRRWSERNVELGREADSVWKTAGDRMCRALCCRSVSVASKYLRDDGSLDLRISSAQHP